jgi:hypothetical protein
MCRSSGEGLSHGEPCCFVRKRPPCCFHHNRNGMVGYLFGARFRSTLDKSWCALSRSGSSRCQHRRGLIVILGVVRSGRAGLAAFAVGGYITAAYWFTSSTSFANSAVTIGRTITNTFASIAPSSVPVFILMQIAGALAAVALGVFLFPHTPASDLVVPQQSAEES